MVFRNGVDMKTITDFANYAYSNGVLIEPHKIVYDRIQRWGTQTRPRSKNGWSRVYCNGDCINAVFGDFQLCGEPIKWHNREKLTHTDRIGVKAAYLEARRQRELERIEGLVNVQANYVKWVKPLFGSHPYIDKKCIADWLQMSIVDPLGIAGCIWSDIQKEYVLTHIFNDASKNVLIIPIRNIDDELFGFQKITATGDKYIHDGSQKKGNFYMVAPAGISLADADRIFIAEGISTGVSAYLALSELLDACNYVVLVSFGVFNITNVVDAVWSKHPNKPITLLADSDDINDKNVGVEECAKIIAKHEATKNINMLKPEGM